MSASLLQLFMVRVLVFFFSSPFDAQEKCISFSQHKTLIRHLTTDVTQREWRAIHFLAFMIVSWLHLRRLPPHALACLTCWPTVFLPSVNPFLLLIHPLAEMEVAARRDSLYPSLSNDRRSPYHFKGSVISRLAERILSLWPKSQTGDSAIWKWKRKRKAFL